MVLVLRNHLQMSPTSCEMFWILWKQIIQYVGTIIIENVPLRKRQHASRNTQKEKHRHHKFHIVKDLWKQLHRLISKPCCRLMTVKSDHWDHSSFISTVTGCDSSNLELPLDFPQKPARRTESNNKVSHTIELGCSSYSLHVSPLYPHPPAHPISQTTCLLVLEAGVKLHAVYWASLHFQIDTAEYRSE